MPNISTELQKLLDSGDYRLVDLDERGHPIINPGEIIMNRKGILIAYTVNCTNKIDTILQIK